MSEIGYNSYPHTPFSHLTQGKGNKRPETGVSIV